MASRLHPLMPVSLFVEANVRPLWHLDRILKQPFDVSVGWRPLLREKRRRNLRFSVAPHRTPHIAPKIHAYPRGSATACGRSQASPCREDAHRSHRRRTILPPHSEPQRINASGLGCSHSSCQTNQRRQVTGLEKKANPSRNSAARSSSELAKTRPAHHRYPCFGLRRRCT